jgi:hypothetical protein
LSLITPPSALLIGARKRIALALIPIAALWLAVLWAAFGGRAPGADARTPRPASVLQAIVASGQASPAGGSFDRFDIDGQAIPAQTNRRGQVLFFATLLRSAAEEGLFLADGSRISKLAAVGDTVPSGERIAGFGEHPDAALNEAGAAAFAASLTGGRATNGLFLVAKGKTAAIALTGAAAPGIPGGTLAGFEQVALNDAGDVAFLATLRHGRETGEAIYIRRSGRLHKLVAAGDSAPSGGIFSSFGNPSLNNKGEVAFPAIVDQGPVLGGVFVSSGGEVRLMLAAGASAPTGGIFARFSERLAINDSGTIALSAVLRQGGPAAAVFLIESDTPRALAAIGDPVPGGGTLAALASWPALGQSGSVAFIGSVDGGPNALAVYLAGADGMKRVAAVGDRLGESGRLAAFPLYPAVSVGGEDAVIFAATVEQDGTRRELLYYFGPARPQGGARAEIEVPPRLP